jgi:hypothetical protein
VEECEVLCRGSFLVEMIGNWQGRGKTGAWRAIFQVELTTHFILKRPAHFYTMKYHFETLAHLQ